MDLKDTKNYTGLEAQFFTWSGWDAVDTAAFQFYDCKLKRDIGNFKKDDKISCALFDVEKSLMEFYDDKGDVIGKFKIKVDAEVIQ